MSEMQIKSDSTDNVNQNKFYILSPKFDSHITDLVIELDYLRKKVLRGTTPPHTFFELKWIFHLMESLGSARIEGNNTTIEEAIEYKIDTTLKRTEKIREIENLESALAFLDEMEYININRALISDLHKKIVDGLTPPPPSHMGWSRSPWAYRVSNVKITDSDHTPPDYTQVSPMMEEMFGIINDSSGPKYDLLKIALAHHRFTWIHPFDNGNGRTVRLFTYAMLISFGFRVNMGGRILNPTAIFCNDRWQYYHMLQKADTLTEEWLTEWCDYVLTGLREEIEKVDKLLDYEYLSKEIILPALRDVRDKGKISDVDFPILHQACLKKVFSAGDIAEIIGNASTASDRSRIIRSLKERGLIQPIANPSSRVYGLKTSENQLTRSIVTMLSKNGFIPLKE